MDVRCRIELFGELRVIQGNQTHTRFRTHKAALLLAYLALNIRGAQPRERLLETFWPDMEPNVARDNLSTALSQLRRQLEPVGVPSGSILLADRQQVRLNAEAVTVDAGDFDRLTRQAKAAEAAQAKTALLQEAVELYRGELLPGCYEEWATREQTHFQSVYLESLRYLTRACEENGRWSEALEYARKASAADPYTEDFYQAQMRLLVRLKRPAAALETYEGLVRLFARELGAQPSAVTRQMAEMIRRDPRAAALLRAAAANQSSPVSAPPIPSGAPAPSVMPSPAPSPKVSPLPLSLTRFFGREQEREQLADLLQTPGARLISILGPGGAGKTRLSIEIAAQVMAHPENRFANRIWFVPLADVPEPGLIPAALVNSLRLPPDAKTDAIDRISDFLGSAPSLLVLDNLEHLLRETPLPGKNENPSQSGTPVLISLLLQRAPNLVCLVTSRQPLRIGGEIEFPLPALPVPSVGETGEADNAVNLAPVSSLEVTALLALPSVQLYVDRARVARPDFALTSHNAPAVAALCRRLEGMPLAIEMAAAWVKTIPPQKMLERLERQLDMLISRRRDLPPRHQSLRATIEWSYNLLLPELRDALELLAVFRGGWTLEAAESLCGPDALHALLALQEQSLIVASEEDEEGNSRYRMLEPLREFGCEKLQQMRHLEAARAAHADYFFTLAQEARQHYANSEEKLWMDRVQADLDNIRAAFTWYLHTPEHEAQQNGTRSLKLARALIRFWTMRGYIAEGRQYLRAALEGEAGKEESLLVADALMCEGNLAWYAGDYEMAQARFESCRALHERLGDAAGAALLYNSLANTAIMLEDYERARRLLEEGLCRNRQLNDRENLAALSGTLGNVQEKLGDLDTARRLYQESVAMWRDIGNRHAVAVNLNNLGALARKNGDYVSAAAYSRESLQIRRDLQDRSGIVLSLLALAALATAEGQAQYAAALYAAAESLRVQLGVGVLTADREAHEANVVKLRALLPAHEWEAAQAQGSVFTQEQAIAFALQEEYPFPE